jgi:hypothetical protein
MHYLKEKIVTAWQEQKRLLLFHGNKKGCLIRATLYIHGGEGEIRKFACQKLPSPDAIYVLLFCLS